ncbi:hypothetical protein PY793_09505 [Acetobacter fabarum]|jgi:intracellular multiplication protein IcmP|uniref:secretion/conjugation apparatus DotM-related subunit n=1 Tax=Acetobacteraceae TaxID=433 RepID=UPI00312BC3C2
MSGARQSTGRDTDPDHVLLAIIGVILVIACLCLLLWYEFHAQIATVLLTFAGMELHVVSLFTHQYDHILNSLTHAKPDKVSAQTLWDLNTITGRIILLPALALFAVLGFLCAVKAPRAIYRHRFGLNDMTRMLAAIHPIGQAWVGGNPKLSPPQPAGKPLLPMDPPLTPDEWLLRYAPGSVDEPQTIRLAYDALSQQLGRVWEGPARLSGVELCLFMTFSLYHARQKDQAQTLLEKLSAALSGQWKKGEIRHFIQLDKKFSQQMQSLYEAGNWTVGIEIAARHAYVRPALMSLLQEARRKAGVVNPSLFSIVQLVDRDLWLILCALPYPMPGRPLHAIVTTSCTEAEGVMEHWRAECLSGTPCPAPQLERTLTTLMTTEANTRHAN